MIDTDYVREFPRDLFNESKLLKCLGQLALLIHDGRIGDLPLTFEETEEQLIIGLCDEWYGLVAVNAKFYYAGEPLDLYIPYNDRDRYPLLAVIDDEIIEVLDDEGNLLWQS